MLVSGTHINNEESHCVPTSQPLWLGTAKPRYTALQMCRATHDVFAGVSWGKLLIPATQG